MIHSIFAGKTCSFASNVATLIKDPKLSVLAGVHYNYTCSGNTRNNPAISAVACSIDGTWGVVIDQLCLRTYIHVPTVLSILIIDGR